MNLTVTDTSAPATAARMLAVPSLLVASFRRSCSVRGPRSGAALTKGDVWNLTCGDVPVTVQSVPGAGTPLWARTARCTT
jgi:hypothetical protein